ncbi:hypothetical protein [Streptomyces sp. RPT161]|uniref:hypothetical protein n=1 Tax=Streptomyces sp. RPT161 TaxID=3015993 RepID=UPI0022B93772|nr:hypothetical protein [Streptomyces sp. RPT161]
MPPELRSEVTAGPGGAMTDEVGVITGDLTVATADQGDGTARVRIQYTGADEWYELEGSPARITAGGLAAVHRAVVDAVRVGGAAHLPA